MMSTISINMHLQACQDSDKSVNRMNYGVQFKYHSNTIPITGIWYHTYRIELPGEKAQDLIRIFGDEHMANATRHKCVDQKDQIIRTFCVQYNPHLKYIQVIAKKGRRYIEMLSEKIHSIIPTFHYNPYEQTKRALLPFVGGILSSLFGVSSEKDVDVLRNHLREIALSTNHELQVLKKSSSDLSSFAVKTKGVIEVLTETVRETARNNVELIQKVATTMTSHISYQESITIYTLQLYDAIQELSLHYSNYLASLESLTAGFLPVYLLDQYTISNALLDLEIILKADGTPYHIIHKEPGWYYKFANFVYLQHQNFLYITMKIPLTTFQYDFTNYVINTYPLLMHDDSDHVTVIRDVPAGISIDKSHTYMYTLTDSEMRDLGKQDHGVTRKVFRLNPKNSCIISIFLDRASDIHKLCRYTILMDTLQQHIQHLYDTTYLMVNVTEYTVDCLGKPVHRTGCKLCLATIPVNCSVYNDKYYLPPTFTTLISDNKSIEHGHISNLPLLLNFFSSDALSMLRGDTFLPDEPIVSIPSFEFYTSNLTKRLAEDKDMAVDLRKAAENLVTDGIIINHLSEAVILGKVEIDVNFWWSIPGVCSELTMIAIMIIAAYVIFISLQIRKLTITLAVIQATILPKTEP